MCNYDISMTHNQTCNLTTHKSLAVPAMELGIDVPSPPCTWLYVWNLPKLKSADTQLFNRGL